MTRAPMRLDERKRCWRVLPGQLFMKLCIVCAYPSAQVLKGLWRTCGSLRGVATSLLLTAIQRDEFRVDKNLYGVSAQVIGSGVLVFGDIFVELIAGYGYCLPRHWNCSPAHREHEGWPNTAGRILRRNKTRGSRFKATPGNDKGGELALADDLEGELDIDL